MHNDIMNGEQNVYMYNRKRLEMTGIDDVESFNESEIVVRYAEGAISLEGEEMKVELFSSETKRLTVTGTISCIEYFGSSAKQKGKSFRKGK